ncbi:alpha/beta-hydrolase [Linnemannia elongata AG-77]|uniref:Alpha/beta-hydrolase n=1 Tax=Linnemannia elongata AG-77 TaxID=1314771 RepID=A0A197KEC1_9FUNG|nr:alpha/beta-hydrolase [Linnemannia elongata AG-77]
MSLPTFPYSQSKPRATYLTKILFHSPQKKDFVEEGNPTDPVLLLIHGFPDLWYGWRHQIKVFAEKGYRVIAIDCLGYGDTDAPEELSKYSLKSVAGQLRDLLDVLEIPDVTLVGHDWGGAVAFRFADWHPERVKALINVCTPGLPFVDYPVPLDMTVELFPTLRYLLYYTDPDLVPLVNSNVSFDLSLCFFSVDAPPSEEKPCLFFFFAFFFPFTLVFLLLVGGLPVSYIHATELDYLAAWFEKTGFEGPLNYYKTGMINHIEELEHPTRNKNMSYPVYLIKGENDLVLIPELAVTMPYLYKNYSTHSIQTGHFAMLEKPQEFNEALEEILTTIYE